MAKITKGFSYGIAVLGVISLLLGVGAIICGGLFANIVSNVKVNEEHAAAAIFNLNDIKVLNKYWWFTFYVGLKIIIILSITR